MSASTSRPGQEPIPRADEPLEHAECRLANGIHIIARRFPSPLIAVNTGFAVGSRHELPGRHGFAHFFEHLMFSQTPALPSRGFHRVVQSLGGNVNATTSTDLTTYYSTVPPDAFDAVLTLERYRFHHLVNDFDSRGLDAERGVVESERHLSILGPAFGDAREVLAFHVFGSRHPYGHLPLADLADVRAATLDSVREFYDDTYRTAKCSVAIVGDIDPAAAIDRAARTFADLSRIATHSPDSANRSLPVVRGEHQVKLVSTSGERVFIGFPVPAFRTVAHDRCKLLAQLLAGGDGGLLQARLGDDLSLIADVRLSFMTHLREATLCMVELVPHPGVDLEYLAASYFAVVRSLSADNLDDADVDRARGLHAWSHYSNKDRSAGRAHDLVVASLLGQPLDADSAHFDEVLASTRDHLSDQLDWFRDAERSVTLLYRAAA